MEIWKPVPEYEGLYEVSDLGRVRSLPRLPRPGTGGASNLGGCVRKLGLVNGYLCLLLSRFGVKKNYRVSRLVLTAFVGPPPEGYEAAHRDGVSTNNNLPNLAWKTPKENQADRLCHGTDNRGERHGESKLTAEAVLEIRRRHKLGDPINGNAALGREFGVCLSNINSVVNRKSWKHI